MALDNILEEYIESEDVFADKVNEIAIAFENAIRQKTPYDTGLLRSSIRTETNISGLEAVITGMWDEGTAPYGIYVHEGTYKMSARPFLEWGLEEIMSIYG